MPPAASPVPALPRSLFCCAQVPSQHLSGGSRRKLQLALALAGEPRLLLLDEVTAGVDAESKQVRVCMRV